MERIWIVSYIVAWGLVLAQGLTLLGLCWMMGRIHLRSGVEGQVLITNEGPEIGSLMPEFEGYEVTGARMRSVDLRGRDVVVLLLSMDCAPCERLLRDLRSVRPQFGVDPLFVAVMEAPPAEVANRLRRYAPATPLLVDEEARLRKRFGVERTPYAFLLDPEGMVQMKGVVNDGAQLEGLIARRGRHIGSQQWEPVASPREVANG